MVDTMLCVLGLACVAAICATDVVQRRIPNVLVAALVGLRALGAVGYVVGLTSELWSPGRLAEQFVAATLLTAALFAFGALMTRLEGRCALGFGDVKLVFALGLWTVPHSLGLFVCLAASLALACALVQLVVERVRAVRRAPEANAVGGGDGFGAGSGRVGGRAGRNSQGDIRDTPKAVGQPGTFPLAPALGIAFVVVTALQMTVLPL